MTTLTQTWNADGTQAVVLLDGTPAGRLSFEPPWTVFPQAGATFTIAELPVTEKELALLKAFIALDEQARGIGPDRSTRRPPPNVRDVNKFRETFADQSWVALASDDEVQRAANAAWVYTSAKVRMKTGLDYDEWAGKQFMAASAIFKRVVRKYGQDVPEPVWD